MYPETDIPAVQITKELLAGVMQRLPEPAAVKLEKLQRTYGLNEKLSKQVIDSEYYLLFEDIAKASTVQPTTVAVFLTETLRALKREGIQTETVSDDQIRDIFKLVDTGQVTKEATSDVFVWVANNPDKTPQDAASALGLKMLSGKELDNIIERSVKENEESVAKLGSGAFGLLMGVIMREVRGRADANVVGKILRDRLNAAKSKK
jgi:glutamyl-tRNA(Gln) amidotransferase subunit E